MGEHFALTVIPEPAEGTRTLLATDNEDDDFVFIKGGETEDSYDCGACGRSLIFGTTPGQIVNFVLRCPGCGAFNET